MVLAAGQHADQAELIAHVKAQIAKFKAPRAVDVVLELPKTSTGKIRKQELRKRLMGRTREQGAGTTPCR